MKGAGSSLRNALSKDMLAVPACYDALSARLVEANGFPAVLISGLGVSLAYAGLPDLDLLTLTELTAISARIADAVQIPVIMDAEHGFGDVHMVAHTVREFERAGLAGIHLEDSAEKRGLDKIGLVPIREMVARIKAAKSAQWDPDFVIVARTDASIESAEEMIRRGNAYAEAGADIIWTCMHGTGILARPAEARVIYELMPKKIDAKVQTNSMYGTEFTEHDARRLGYAMLSIPAPGITAAARALDECFRAMADGTQAEYFRTHPPYTLGELSKLCGMERFEALQRQYYGASATKETPAR